MAIITDISDGKVDELIFDLPGNDTIDAPSGDNQIQMEEGGSNAVNGGTGRNTVLYEDFTTGITANLDTGFVRDGLGNVDTLKNVVGINATQFGDTIELGLGGTHVFARAGDDTIRAGVIGSVITPGSGKDKVYGNVGKDVVVYFDGGRADQTEYDAKGVIDHGVKISLKSGRATDGWGDKDLLFSIEDVIGSELPDTIVGSDVANVLSGGSGNDKLNGGKGNDTLNGDVGDDTLDGGAGRDALNGGVGTDTASYAAAAAGVTASLKRPSFNIGDAKGDAYVSVENLTGSSKADTLFGNNGDNGLNGGGGADRLNGEGGNDTLNGGAGRDRLDGAAGTDTASYAGAKAGVTASLAKPSGNKGDAKGDAYVSIENLTGSGRADTLVGNGGRNVLSGGAGNDALNGGSGSDTLNGGAGRDRLDGGAGTDTASYAGAKAGVTASLANASGNTGDAKGDAYVSIENLTGSDGRDMLVGDGARNVLSGGDDIDILSGGGGNDILNGGANVDFLDGGAGIDTASYDGAKAGVTASLAKPSGNTGDAGGDTYVSIENLTGSGKADTLVGDGSKNVLDGAGGDDMLGGGAGDDALNGGSGNDTLNGGAGRDRLDGGAGTDTASYAGAMAGVTASLADASGNTGEAKGDAYSSIENLTGSGKADTLTGNGGRNVLSAGIGDDALNGGGGNDTLNGGAGRDRLDGGAGADTASYAGAKAGVTASLAKPSGNKGDAKGDVYVSIENLTGSGRADTLVGDGGRNVLSGGAGNDGLNGGGGDDLLDGGAGSDRLNGGSGRDTASYAGAKAGVTASLTKPSFNFGDAKGDAYVSIENLTGSGKADTLVGDSNRNVLDGAGGDDRITSGKGNDTLIGGAGNDILDGGAGRDRLDGGAGTDTASYATALSGVTASLDKASANKGDAKGDVYVSIQNLTGSGAADTLTGSKGSNILTGEAGNDALSGGGGNDLLDGGAGGDRLSGGSGTDTASYAKSLAGVTASLTNASGNTGDAQGDTYASIENLTGSGKADTLTGNAGRNLLSGGKGSDTLNGNGGNDILSGGKANDTLDGGAGNDVLSGGSGRDKFAFTFAPGAKTNVDTISDFGEGDTILLSKDLFDIQSDPATGRLSAGQFKAFGVNGDSLELDDRIIYDGLTGALSYDKDGVGEAKGVVFAYLTDSQDSHALLAATDFLVV